MILLTKVKCDSLGFAWYLSQVPTQRDVWMTCSEIQQTPYHTFIKFLLSILFRYVLAKLSCGAHGCLRVLGGFKAKLLH